MKLFKQYFKGWGFNQQGAARKKREMQEELLALEILEEDELINSEKVLRKVALKCEVMKLLEDEELHWFKRSHETWLCKGDNNTEYFYIIANGRKRKNTIIPLIDGGDTIEGDENLLKHATKFYKELFCPAPGNLIPIDESMWEDGEKVLRGEC